MKFFTLAVSLAVASFVGAAAASPVTKMSVPAGVSVSQLPNGKSMFHTAPHMESGARAASKLSITVPKPEDTTVITEAPAGKATDYSRASDAFGVMMGMLLYAEDSGLTVNYVEGEDGKVYISNPFSQFPLHAYLEATREGDVLSIAGAQAVLEMVDETTGELSYAYACPMVSRATPDGGEWFFADTKNPLQMTVKGDSIVTAPETFIGLFVWDEEQKDLAWTGYGDYNMKYSRQTSSLVTPPADLATDRWSMILDDGTGYFVNVGAAQDALYVQGLYGNTPNSWVKLDVNGSKAVLNDVQYLGKDENWHYAYAVGGVMENQYIEEWDDYIDVAVPQGVLPFDYNAEARTLTTSAPNALIICTQENCTAYSAYFPSISIMKQDHVAGTLPLAPQGLYTNVYEPGSVTLEFALPMVDVDGALLETANISYRVFVDGELFEFYNDEYTKLPQPQMNELPWGFTEGYDFYATGVYHSIYFYFEGYETLGVQTVYREPGNESAPLYSEITTLAATNDPDGIEGVAQGTKQVKSVEYFDLQGRSVAAPAKGLNIVRTTFADGTSATRKAFVR